MTLFHFQFPVVTTTVKILGLPSPATDCEKEFDNAKLRSRGKEVLACVQIPTMINDRPKNLTPRKQPNVDF